MYTKSSARDVENTPVAKAIEDNNFMKSGGGDRQKIQKTDKNRCTL